MVQGKGYLIRGVDGYILGKYTILILLLFVVQSHLFILFQIFFKQIANDNRR